MYVMNCILDDKELLPPRLAAPNDCKLPKRLSQHECHGYPVLGHKITSRQLFMPRKGETVGV